MMNSVGIIKDRFLNKMAKVPSLKGLVLITVGWERVLVLMEKETINKIISRWL